ncbi:MAG: sulfate permease [Bacteroidetes bacterium]|nr:sulfate permease [Bacteroidota bacterium]
MPEPLPDAAAVNRPFSLQRLRPDWWASYSGSQFKGDLAAGITVGVVLIPQGMAYALLAGVSPVYGLYASLVPLLIYSLFGTSRHLAVGVVAIDSLIVAAGVASLAPGSAADALSLTFLLALMVGIIQVVMGLLRFGFVVNLLSRPVITGFTGAAALIIGFSQFKHMLGVDLGSNLNIFVLLMEAAGKVGQTHVPSLLIGAIGIALLVLGRRFVPRLPGPLLVVVLSTLAVLFLDLEQVGVQLVGVIPSGLPAPAFPVWSMDTVQALFPTAVTLSLIQFVGVISLGKLFAARHGYRIRPNRELTVLGSMNVLGSLFQSIPVSGSFSRSAVNERAGAKSPLANGVAALLIAGVLLFLTPLFAWLPIPIFASIIMVSAFGLIDVKEVRWLLGTKATDGVIALLTFLATLVLGIHQGILTGIGLSVIQIMYRISRPNIAVLGHLAETRSFRNVANHPDAQQFEGILMLRVDASFSFANADRVRDTIITLARERDARHVILDTTTMNDLDLTALAMLQETYRILATSGVSFLMAGAHQPVLDVLQASGLWQEISPERFFLSPWRALTHTLRASNRLDELSALRDG